MAQVLMGKLLPNLKITLDDSNPEDNIEDGEITDESDDSKTLQISNKEKTEPVKIVRSWMETLPNPKVYENKNGAFITGIDLTSAVVMKKLEERAARFGLEKNEEFQVTQNEINALYNSMGVDIESKNSNKIKNIRLNTIHMRGVNEMNTNEIFQYFNDYGPSSVEWINDYSCNIVWLDDASAARALLGMSRVLSIRKKEKNSSTNGDEEGLFKESKMNEAIILMSDSEESDNESSDSTSKNEEDTAMDVDEKNEVNSNDDHKTSPPIDVPIPPGFWRLGMPNSKAKALLLRFATREDRKLPGAEKRSHFYQKYGNPNYGGLRGLISTSKKRKMQAAKNREEIGKLNQEIESDANTENSYNRPIKHEKIRSKLPRMRMYADDEEDKKNKKKKVFRSEEKKKDIFSRLGNKYTKEDLYHLGRKFSDDEDNEDKRQETRKVSSRFNIWNDIAKSMAEEDTRMPQKITHRGVPKESSGSLSQKLTNFRYHENEKYESSESSHFFPKSYKRTNSGFQGDLRSKIKKMKKDDLISKHRSPLWRDEISNDSE